MVAFGCIAIKMRQWVCMSCGFGYDEAEGLPDQGVASGTRFEDLPDDWKCPDCDLGKAEFFILEE